MTIEADDSGCAMCDGATYAEMLRHYTQKIKEHGYTVVYVSGDEESLPFAYTIGLTEKGLPEFILSGKLSAKSAYVILSIAAQEALTNGEIPLGINTTLYNIRADFQAITAHVLEEYMLGVKNMYPSTLKRAVNIIWADAENRLPGDAGFNENSKQIHFKNLVN
jgi:hypothetical protein